MHLKKILLTALIAMLLPNLYAQPVKNTEATNSARAFLQRILHNDARFFSVQIIPKPGKDDLFELESRNGKILPGKLV